MNEKSLTTVTSTSRLPYRLDPSKAQEHTNHIRRFRILVMGRTNAGKTTILQRVCNTTEQPEIFNGKGERVGPTVVEGRQQRDYRNIEDELVFRSNAKIVFHDSRGFEAGSEEQFKMMKKFVTDRANTSKLDKRIHAIWFCIPLNDSHRMVMAAERFFDECDTGHVPVIVVLTKADTLTLDAVQKLMNKGMSIDGAVKEAAEVANKMVDASLVRVKDLLKGNRFPPKGYLSLTRMQTEGADCTPLLTCTRNVLEEERLGQLLTSTQQSNLLSPNDAA
ncbi:GTP-binding protein [Pisolithus albus]|nr:GTP-binding protein [Pisolithus albus]